MHKSYLTFLKNLNETDWDYSNEIFEKLNSKIPFLKDNYNSSDVNKFIKDYLDYSGKRYLTLETEFNNISPKRPFHVVSNFFVGILIYKYCELEKEMDLLKKNKLDYNTFILLWMLTNFLHDYAELFENEKLVKGRTISTLSGLLSVYDIKNNALSKSSKKIPKPIYDNIEEYFNYRISINKIDHGIHAGLLFFDLLVKNRIEKMKQNTNLDYWHSDLDIQYRHIAQVICVHNIWVNQNEDFYNYPSLAPLNNFKPFSFKEYPFFFLMALVDTIEPIKFFHYNNNPNFLKFEVDIVLKNLEFNFGPKSFSIKLKGDLKSAYISYYKHIYKNTFGWLKLEIKTIEKNSEIVIDF